MLKRIKYFFSTEAGLQVRMTLWVSLAVLIVAVVVMTIATSVLRHQYESELKSQLSNDINATTQLLDQRMQRVEYTTRTTASLIEKYLEDETLGTAEANLKVGDRKRLAQMMFDLMNDIECIDAAYIALDNHDDSTVTAFAAYNAAEVGDRKVLPLEPRQDVMINDENWIASFHEGRETWSALDDSDVLSNSKTQWFSVPIYAPDGTRIGMMCSMILESWIIYMIPQYKTRPDIDLSIYDNFGNCIVSPDDYILELSPEDLLTEERLIDRFQWRLVFSADRHIITDRLQPVVWLMAGTLMLLLVFIALAIAFTVKYVARPFVQKQEQMASAKASMERELQIAANTQRQLVPHRFPPFPDRPEISIHGCLHPAREVGGDLYDYFIEGDRLYFCLGDVSGKGAPASLFMAATHYLFRSVVAAMPMSDALQQMNVSLCTDNEACTFVTFLIGCLDLKTGVLEYSNAGHNSPILIHDGEARFFAPSQSPPLGVWEDADYNSDSILLCKDDVFLLYTDGVTEAMNSKGEEFGDAHTLTLVNSTTDREPQALIDTILGQVRRHAGDAPQSDDITMLCIRLNVS